MDVRHTLTEEADEPAFGGNESKNRQPYPSWWTQPTSFKNGQQLETLKGFPTISYWFIEAGQLGQFPHKKLSECKPPPSELIATFMDLIVLQSKWQMHSSGQTKKPWLEAIGYPAAEFWDKHWEQWENYLAENMTKQCQFFGIPFHGHEKMFNSTSPYFKKPLIYYPGKWRLMVGLSLAIVFVRKLVSDPAHPFIPWDCTDVKPTSSIMTNVGLIQRDYFLDLIREGNEAKINQVVAQPPMRMSGANSLRATNLDLSFQKYMDKYQLAPLVLFKEFLKNGGFSNNSKDELNILFLRDFRTLYASMFQHYHLATKIKSSDCVQFNELDINPMMQLLNRWGGQNLRCTLDWTFWSLMCIHHDICQTKLSKDYLAYTLPKDFYDRTFTKPLYQIKQENQKTVVVPEGVHIPDWIKKDVEKGGGKFETPTQHVLETMRFTLPFTFENVEMTEYVINFGKKWSDTATFNLLGIGDAPWPLQHPPFHFEENSYDQKFLNMMLTYTPGRLRKPPMDWSSFERKNTKWIAAFQRQFLDYLDWIDMNVKAQDNPNYTPPGEQLKDLDGDRIIGPDGNPLLNTYPNYMIESDTRGLSRVVAFAMIPLDQAAKFVFGDDWTEFLDDLAQKVWDRIKKALKDLYNWVKKILPVIWPYLLAIGGGIIVFLGVETFAVEKIKIAAQ